MPKPNLSRLNARPNAALLAALSVSSLAALAAPAAEAQDLFSVDATTTTGFGGLNAGPAFRVASSDLPDLLEDAVRSRDQFAAFLNTNSRFSFDYADIDEAIVITVNDSNTQATLEIPGIDFSRTFNAGSRSGLEDEITDFLEDDGADVYADFLRFVREESTVSVIDGNPNSATALVATTAFRDFGTPSLASVDGVGHRFSLAGGRDGFFKVGAAASTFDASGFEGDDYRLTLAAGVDLTRQIGLAWSSVLNFRDIEDTAYYAGGGSIALPITVWSSDWGRDAGTGAVVADPNGTPAPTAAGRGAVFSARITPMLQIGSGGSIDAADGGLFWGYGAGATLTADFDGLRLNAAAQLVAYDGIDVGYDDYEFATDLEQQVLSLGVHGAVHLGNAFTFDAGVDYHDYLDDAATDNWVSPTVGLAWAPDETTLRVGYQGERLLVIGCHSRRV